MTKSELVQDFEQDRAELERIAFLQPIEARAVELARMCVRLIAEKEWRPIETAPRDGTYILVMCKNAIVANVYRWDAEYDDWTDDTLFSKHAVKVGDAWEQLGVLKYWLPLPQPPTDTKP